MSIPEAMPAANHRAANTPKSALRLATLTLLLVLTARLILSESVDPMLVQAISAAIMIGLPFIYWQIQGKRPAFARPSRRLSGSAVIIGVLASVAGAWLITVTSNLLTNNLGSLAGTQRSSASDLLILLVLGILLPVGQSVLFWWVVQPALAGISRFAGVGLVASLLASSGIITNSLGLSAAISLLPLALCTGLVVFRTGNPWLGTIALLAYGLASLLLPNYLLDLLGLNALSLNWIGATVLSLFGLFFLYQMVKATTPPYNDYQQPQNFRYEREPSLWLYGALAIGLVLLEIFMRSQA